MDRNKGRRIFFVHSLPPFNISTFKEFLGKWRWEEKAKELNIWISIFSLDVSSFSTAASNDHKHKWKQKSVLYPIFALRPYYLLFCWTDGRSVWGGWEGGQEKEAFSSLRPLQMNHPWASAGSPRYSFAFGADHNPISFCPGTLSFSSNMSHKVLLLGACSPTSLQHFSLLMGFHVELSTLRNGRLFGRLNGP